MKKVWITHRSKNTQVPADTYHAFVRTYRGSGIDLMRDAVEAAISEAPSDATLAIAVGRYTEAHHA